MKKRKTFEKIGKIILAVFALVTIGWMIFVIVQFVNCATMRFLKGDAKATDLFIYSEEDDGIRILGLTKEGGDKKNLIIPSEINGKPVLYLGCNTGFDGAAVSYNFDDYGCINFASAALQKVYVMPDVRVIGCYANYAMVPESKNFVGFMLLSATADDATKSNIGNFVYSASGTHFKRANLSYCYNYENAPNDGYYWIDDWGYGAKIEFIPPEPERKGYTFGGWYKEPECINKWNFETDVLPEERTEINEDGEEEVVYQETKLYAKWIGD